MTTLPKRVQELIDRRSELRQSGEFAEADQIRDQLIAEGYQVSDLGHQTQITPHNAQIQRPAFLILFGSGEISSTGRKIHDYVLSQIGLSSVKIAIISTPAGFQPNVKVVCGEIADFFRDHLTNFHPKISIIYADTIQEANNPDLLSPLNEADYIFMGPGSPTYAQRHLEGTVLLEKIFNRIQNGASLCLSSAAVLAFSRVCLPVYEIYKVGEKVGWKPGLNAYQKLLNKNLTVVPHFNNQEGGRKNDTSYCYMGRERFRQLVKLLPPDAGLMGIDENTTLVANLTDFTQTVLGVGKVYSKLEILKALGLNP